MIPWEYVINGALKGFIDHPEIYEVSQFTDLFSKSGVEIYEGDILSRDGGEIYYAIVKFNNGSFVVDTFRYHEPDYTNHSLAGLMTYSYEVIGNIYESKHFLTTRKR
jgi:hypothetical protein